MGLTGRTQGQSDQRDQRLHCRPSITRHSGIIAIVIGERRSSLRTQDLCAIFVSGKERTNHPTPIFHKRHLRIRLIEATKRFTVLGDYIALT